MVATKKMTMTLIYGDNCVNGNNIYNKKGDDSYDND